MGRKFEDLTGQIFGNLTVVERCEDYVSPKGQYQHQWLCKCNCGNKTKVATCHLKNGLTKTCGHCNDIKRGDRFSKLTAIERCEDYIEPSGKHRTQWLCKCDCGKEIKVTSANLKRGNTKSCGRCNNVEFVDPYDGKKHEGSVKNICGKCGFRYITISSRLKQGFTFEEAISIKSSVKISKICKINFCGKHFEGNLKQICEYFNKSYDQVYEFMTYNKTLEWALEHTNDVV